MKNFTLNLSRYVLFKSFTSYFLDDLLRVKVLVLLKKYGSILGCITMQILIWRNNSISLMQYGKAILSTWHFKIF